MTYNGHATYQRSLTVKILWKNGAKASMQQCCKIVTIPIWFSEIHCTACNHKAFFNFYRCICIHCWYTQHNNQQWWRNLRHNCTIFCWERWEIWMHPAKLSS